MKGVNIRVSKDVHKELVDFIIDDGERKIGKFTEIAIKDRIEKEKINLNDKRNTVIKKDS